MTLLLSFILGAATCSGASPAPLPALASVTSDDLRGVRTLIDGKHPAAARAKWAALTGWSPTRGATAYGRADAAFSKRHYRTAFGLYHDEVFSCGPTSELNPQAFDAGTTVFLERALRHASSGDYRAAAQLLQSADERDPSSIESRYFLGLVDSARGAPGLAQAAWKAAIDSDGYTQPPDGWTLNRALEATLQRFLETDNLR